MRVYLTGGFYRAHADAHSRPDAPFHARKLSFVYFFHREPSRFSGGDLLLYDTDPDAGVCSYDRFSRIVPLRNSIVFFPSVCWHQVAPVQCETDDFGDGRWAVPACTAHVPRDPEDRGEALLHVAASHGHDPAPPAPRTSPATWRTAARLRSTSSSVVAHEETLMRIAARPFQCVPPHQQVPSRCTPRMTSVVTRSSPNATSTWLSTTSLRISKPASRSPAANRRAWRQLRSTSSSRPSRPNDAIAAQTSRPRMRRLVSGVNSNGSRLARSGR